MQNISLISLKLNTSSVWDSEDLKYQKIMEISFHNKPGSRTPQLLLRFGLYAPSSFKYREKGENLSLINP
jgi:hypothetical protein